MSEQNLHQEVRLDALDALIVSRLGERQRKLERMAALESQMQQRSGIHHRSLWWTVAAAACIAVCFALTPLWKSSSPLDELNIACPQLTAYRAAMPQMTDIQRCLEAEEWEKARTLTKQALQQSDAELAQMSAGDANDAALQYEWAAEQEMNAELRWTYIYTLVRTERKDEARKELDRYLQQPSLHAAEAKALADALN